MMGMGREGSRVWEGELPYAGACRFWTWRRMRCATSTSPRRTGAALSRDAGQPGGEILFHMVYKFHMYIRSLVVLAGSDSD